ncbi:MAG: DUF697 domain-containing protein [Desulfovibrio sp.]|nr:DUF697 domain-containing protein [Desulfovibrio sp.]
MSAPRCLRLLFGGRQGAGKTCLASALAGQPLVWSPGRGPKPAQASWKRAGMAFTALELPGFGVEGQGEPRRQELQAGALAGADLLVLAAPAPEEAWGLEAGWLAGALAATPGFPVLVCATRIDLLGSPRDWEPEALERELACGRPASPKAKAVAAWARRLEDALAVAVPSFRPERFCLTAAGDGTPAFGASFGMDRLRRLVCQSLPEAVQHRARLALALDSEELRPKAEKIIWTASVSAAAASLAPVPAVDAAMVATVQAGMIVAIAGLYGCVLSRKTALAMLAPAAGALGLRVALASALKILPGIGHAASGAIGAAVAGPMTMAVGYAFLDFFARAEFSPSPAEVRQAFAEKFREARARQGELLARARDRAGDGGKPKARDRNGVPS